MKLRANKNTVTMWGIEDFVCIMMSIVFIGIAAFTRYYDFSRTLTFVFAVMLSIVVVIMERQLRFSRSNVRYFLLFTGYVLFSTFLTKGDGNNIGLILSSIWWGMFLARYRINRFGFHVICLSGYLMFALILFHINTFQMFSSLSLDVRSNMINPNVQGFMMCFISSMTIVLCRYCFTFYRRQHLDILQIIITVWGIGKSSARGALVCFIFFLVLYYIIPRKLKMKKFFMTTVYRVIVIAGIVIPVIYVYLFLAGFHVSYESFTGKAFYSGREFWWGIVFEALSTNLKHWIVGLGGLSTSTHNTFLTVLVNFGLIGWLLYYGFFDRKIREVYEHGASEVQINMLIVGISAFADGIFEPIPLNWAFIIPMAFIWALPQMLEGAKERL